ncbi:hypothetical protein MNEG_6686, partial [Monoraphidium neglectum]
MGEMAAAHTSASAAMQQQQSASTSSGSGSDGSAVPGSWQQLRTYATGGRGLVPSRKPAVKKPARHQWHYCAVDYDPMLPKPSQPLPPYAPPRAHLKDYKAIFNSQMPRHNRR